MSTLLTHLNSLPVPEQVMFARRCKTSVGYIRKAVSKGQRFDVALCISFERESGGAVRCEEVRPDVDWSFLRGSKHKRAA